MAEQRVQRRLAAILAADIVGYSRMMEADEAGTLVRLKTLRAELLDPKVAEYGGRVVKTTGDGALIEFPSAVDAIQHAIDVQREMARRNAEVPEAGRIVMRMGINLGDIIIDGDDIYGDGVNVASRLEGLAEPGGICISGTVHEHVRKKLDTPFEDLGAQQVKNIVEPVRVYRVRPPVEPKAAPLPGEALPLPDRPSIAVLPFANMSGDPEQEYFADGMAEDIITALSRFRWFFVIARNSSFVYKGKAVDVRAVGRELGVRYVLEGSVRKSAGRLRITAQLVEAATGNHLWAEKYDGAVEDVFDLQDKITEGVVGAVEPSVRKAEIGRARLKRPDSLDAYDLVLRALPVVGKWFGHEDIASARALIDRALAIDPNYAAAHASAIQCDVLLQGVTVADPAVRERMMRHVHAVLALDTDDAAALGFAAFVLGMYGGDHAGARSGLDQALALNPNCAEVLIFSAVLHSFTDRLDLAEEHARRALRLSPFDPRRSTALTVLSRACFLLGRYDEAVAAARQSIQANPRFPPAYAWLAAACIRLGRNTEAEDAAGRLREADPNFRCKTWVGLINSPPAHREAAMAALREAGLRE